MKSNLEANSFNLPEFYGWLLIFACILCVVPGQKKLFHVKEYLSPKDLNEKGLSPILDAMEVADYTKPGTKKRLLRYVWPDSTTTFEQRFSVHIQERGLLFLIIGPLFLLMLMFFDHVSWVKASDNDINNYCSALSQSLKLTELPAAAPFVQTRAARTPAIAMLFVNMLQYLWRVSIGYRGTRRIPGMSERVDSLLYVGVFEMGL